MFRSARLVQMVLSMKLHGCPANFSLGLMLLLAPSVALAGNYQALFYLFGFQAASYLWPFVLPLFYLKEAVSKLGLYLLMLMVPLGLTNLITYPWTVYYGLAPWLGIENIGPMPPAFIFGRELVGFALCIWLLPKVRGIWLKAYPA